jgi:hypothetical protein
MANLAGFFGVPSSDGNGGGGAPFIPVHTAEIGLSFFNLYLKFFLIKYIILFKVICFARPRPLRSVHLLPPRVGRPRVGPADARVPGDDQEGRCMFFKFKNNFKKFIKNFYNLI